jgi:hypothetical protein
MKFPRWNNHPALLALLLLVPLTLTVSIGTSQAQYYEAYYLFNGAYPDNEGTPYADEFQGLTHDDNNWFLSSNKYEGDDKVPQLWKVPVQYALKDVTLAWPGVMCKKITETPLAALGYSHYGDISYYNFKGQGYIIVPVEYEVKPYPLYNLIAFFTADSLKYVDSIAVSGFPADNDPSGRSFGWIAVDPSGYLYASGDGVSQLYKFSLNWDKLGTNSLTLSEVARIPLYDESGYALTLGRVQGGAFSESGRLLYLVTGTEDQEHQFPDDGVDVLDTKTWHMVARSSNGSGHFNYKYDWGFPSYNEPEGITIWDIDKVSNADPSVHGQLHVGMLNNEWPDADNVTLYHYINTIYVDPSSSEEETGEPHKPFKTLGGAYSLAWNGARVKIKTGSYTDVLTFAKGIQLLAKDGKVLLGGLGQLSLTTSAAVNLYNGGALKLSGQ